MAVAKTTRAGAARTRRIRSATEEGKPIAAEPAAKMAAVAEDAPTSVTRAQAATAPRATKKSAAPRATADKPTEAKAPVADKAPVEEAVANKAAAAKSSEAKASSMAQTSAPGTLDAAAALGLSTAISELSKEQEIAAYRDMLLIRRFEEKAGQLYGMGYIGGFCHLYIGQEAVVVGMQLALKPGDQVITGYRDHGHMLACRMDPKGVMAELTGRRGGYSKGKGGSMHMFSVEKGFFGGHGIVGAQVSLGTGLSFANRYRGNDNVSITYFGDGASNQGQVYESFNMAKLWKLPVVYVIENNQYGMGTSVKRASSTTDLCHRGRSFDIPGDAVDGMDVRAVKAAAEKAVAHARAGNGPYILEMLTYRYRGHSMSDPAKYRSKEEVQKMRTEHDPIEHVRDRLIEKKWASEDDLKAIDKEIRDIVNESAEFAQTNPEPDASELWTDIVR